MGQDARHFFDSVYERKIPTHFKKWVVAPNQLSKKVHKLIKQEIEAAKEGRKAYIFVKVNALVDEDTIESLYKASQAGVKIDLVVRGACSLIPGLKGVSDNIRVISILDYFLEHSRIYYFENSQKLYLSSADWMPRNFLRRLEIAFPVLDDRLYSFLRDAVLTAYLKDTAQAKELTAQGVWKTRTVSKGDTPFRSQFFFRELAENKYRGTVLE
jgi:polyphosphate kinase